MKKFLKKIFYFFHKNENIRINLPNSFGECRIYCNKFVAKDDSENLLEVSLPISNHKWNIKCYISHGNKAGNRTVVLEDI